MAEDTAEQYDPGAHTVPEVTDYLSSADDAERERVLVAEEAGQARKGILGQAPTQTDPVAPEPSDAVGLASGDTATVRVFEDQAANADTLAAIAAGDAETASRTPEDAQNKGYIGVSPARELDGRTDKGLSQRSILGK